MVCPPILMECSVTEDSSFGAAGVGSAGFSFSTVLVSRSCAAAANEAKPRTRVKATAMRRLGLGNCELSGSGFKPNGLPFTADVLGERVYTPAESEDRGGGRGWRVPPRRSG